MKTTSIEKYITLADGLSVIVTTDDGGQVRSVERVGYESMDAVLILRLADLVGREDQKSRSVCADHGEFQPEKGSYLCPACQAEKAAERAERRVSTEKAA